MKKLLLHLVFSVALLSAGVCEGVKPVVAVISIRASGELFIDGVKSDPRQLHQVLAARQNPRGEVWIHRARSIDPLRPGSEIVEIVRSYGFQIRSIQTDPLKVLPIDARYRMR